MTRTLHISGLANARDLGGLERRDGAETPTGVFIRAERLDRVDADGWRSLRAIGVRTVVDLRRPDERSGRIPPPVDHVQVDLDGDEADFWAQYEADGRWGTPLYYLPHLDDLPHRLTAVLDALAAAEEGAVLFHCSAGWDRTGLVSAVLLRALDTTEDAATADYLDSFATADAAAVLHGRSSEVAARHEVLRRFGHTPESAFREAYAGLDLDAWFHHADVAPRTRAAIESWRGSVSPPA
ncbi:MULTISPECIES: tyrosine-protein phosphatase [unclassified Microbacterium]|uniref:tyrosine-protein phosphatase n=1 Tax=unclassified Microbacterium TaxID=2609290 RepID=UPI0030159BC1